MKKILVLTVISLITFVCNAQKNFTSEFFNVDIVDDFGDKTGETRIGIAAEGYFSNSATTNSCAYLILGIDSYDSDYLYYSLYEYCRNVSSKEKFHITFIGTTTNEMTSNEIVIGKFLTNHFLLLCKNNDTIKVKMVENTEYSRVRTTAVFILYNCKEFYNEYVNRYGELEVKSGPGLRKLK